MGRTNIEIDDELSRLGRLLGRFELLPVQGLADYEAAAGLYRRCRRAGETVRKLTDCLIAVVAMRAGAPLLHRDQDFDVIARHAPLRVAG
jgi:predicted nucleic acid-binding protein